MNINILWLTSSNHMSFCRQWPCKLPECLCLILGDTTVLLFLTSTGVLCCHLIQRMNVVSVPEGERGKEGHSAFHWVCCVCAGPHSLGPWDPRIIRCKRPAWRFMLPPRPTSSPGWFRPNHMQPADTPIKQLWVFSAIDMCKYAKGQQPWKPGHCVYKCLWKKEK